MSREKIQENFVGVLFEYQQYGNVSTEGEIVLSLIDEEIIESYNDIFRLGLEDKIIELEELEDPSVTDVKIVEEELGNGLSIKINNMEYRYVSDKYSVTELRHKLLGLLRVSANEAINWLKRNAVNYWNERQIKPKDLKLAETRQEVYQLAMDFFRSLLRIAGVHEVRFKEGDSFETQDFVVEKREKFIEIRSKHGPAKLWIRTQREVLDAFLNGESVSPEEWLKYHTNVFASNEVTLQNKIKEWQKKIDEKDLNDKIQLVPLKNGKGLIITVFEGKDGVLHKDSAIIEEIKEFVKKRDNNVDITENWEFDINENEGLAVWYTSFIFEEDFDKVEDTEEFKNKMREKMNSVVEMVSGDDFDIKYKDFVVTDDLNVDIIFEGNIKNEDIDENNIEEYLEKEGFTGQVIDKMGEVVDDYEDTFLQIADLDINLNASDLEIIVEFKVVNDVGEDDVNEDRTMRNVVNGVSDSDLLGEIDINEFRRNGGKYIIEHLQQKEIIRDNVEYKSVLVYKGDGIGRVIFGFVYENLAGYDQPDFASVSVGILDADLIELLQKKFPVA